MLYFHNTKQLVENMLVDYTEISVYESKDGIPLLEFTNLKTGLSLLHFIQGIIPDSNNNRHIFYGLKNMEDVIINESLWSLSEMEEKINRIG